MKLYFVKTPKIIERVFNKYIWSFSSKDNAIYLTFDDGPTPEVTSYVLDLLKKYNIKATFFCVGQNIVQNLELFNRIVKEGHAIGNHTFKHLNGWKTSFSLYVEDVNKVSNVYKTTLFRPPYGKITKKQAIYLLQNGYQIVMWSLLSGDFDNSISADQCYNNINKNINSGDILVFHDSLKSEKIIKNALEKILVMLLDKGFVFKKIT